MDVKTLLETDKLCFENLLKSYLEQGFKIQDSGCFIIDPYTFKWWAILTKNEN